MKEEASTLYTKNIYISGQIQPFNPDLIPGEPDHSVAIYYIFVNYMPLYRHFTDSKLLN